MKYTAKEKDELFDTLNKLVNSLGLTILDLTVNKRKLSIQILLTVYKNGLVGTDDCAKVHRCITPRLEITFPQKDLYIEVSSPGIERLIKDGNEFPVFIGRSVKAYCTDISEWKSGVLLEADATHIEIKIKDRTESIPLDIIAKAKLEDSAS
ncbi:MAG: ribosome maturation factor RimP [Termitinemataceae bacterium]|nr:MAG: ribosome maturation factor RimP [Termitinemataceae bacterium]